MLRCDALSCIRRIRFLLRIRVKKPGQDFDPWPDPDPNCWLGCPADPWPGSISASQWRIQGGRAIRPHPPSSQTINFEFDVRPREKISKIGATRCQILRLKCTKFDFRWGSAPGPSGEAYSTLPDPLAVFKGLLLSGGRRRGRAKGSGREREMEKFKSRQASKASLQS